MADPYKFLVDRHSKLRPALPWANGDLSWPQSARSALSAAIGVVNEPWPVADIQVTETRQERGYRRSWVSFPSRDGWNGCGWLLESEPWVRSGPAVICLPGHGAGANAIVGLVEEPYHANFAVQCVRRGWTVLAIEQVSFGANRSSRETERGSSCFMDSLFTVEMGETMTGWRVRDAMAGARALRTLTSVDPERIATLGISGGGLTALWTAALDSTVLAAGVSGYFCPMIHSILRFDHCPDNYIPGLNQILDVPDLAGLIAPRWLGVENGDEDHIFAVEGFNSATARAAEIYAASGVPERFASEVFKGGHEFRGALLLDHIDRAFES